MYKKQYQIRSSEIDINQVLSYPSIIKMMQETSMQHIIELKASFWDMVDQNTTWVLLKKEVKFMSHARLNDLVEVATYPSGFNRIFAYRDYHMYHHATGKKIAEASSLWTLIDLNTRKPQMINDSVLKDHIPQEVDFLSIPDFKIKPLVAYSQEWKTVVSFYDLDWNGHANNNYLSQLIMGTVDRAWHMEYDLKRFSIQYKSECFYKNELICYSDYTSETSMQHQLIRSSDLKEICICETEWQKKEHRK